MQEDFQVLSDKIDSLKEVFEDRFMALERKIEEDRANCQKLCNIMIQHAEEKADLAHKRLDEHKEVTRAQDEKISNLQNWRYYLAGGIAVVAFIATIIVPRMV